jgi:metal-responsive CopG/Arc/MetJ family transcriptional regulator
MGKANISFPDGLLEEIDRCAAASGITRSGFVQEAASHYIADLDADRTRVEREHGIGDAMQRMRKLAARLDLRNDDELVRRLRDAPPRLERDDE